MSESLKIFVISTDKATLQRALGALKTKGFAIAGTTDPSDIRKALKANIDVLVMDIRLQRPKAVEIARTVRKTLPELAIIALSPKVVALPSGSPFTALLKFPLAPPVLQDRIRRAVHATRLDTRALEAEIELAHMQGAGADHYGLLGIKPTASQDQITAAYDRLSLLLHPDKVRHIQNTSARETALELFVRAGEAYSVLRDPASRRRYDLALAKGTPMTDASSLKANKIASLDDLSEVGAAKQALRKAQRAVNTRHFDIALIQLDFALSLDPDNALIEAEVEKYRAMVES